MIVFKTMPLNCFQGFYISLKDNAANRRAPPYVNTMLRLCLNLNQSGGAPPAESPLELQHILHGDLPSEDQADQVNAEYNGLK